MKLHEGSADVPPSPGVGSYAPPCAMQSAYAPLRQGWLMCARWCPSMHVHHEALQGSDEPGRATTWRIRATYTHLAQVRQVCVGGAHEPGGVPAAVAL